MKKMVRWSKSYLLPFCLLLAFGLMSCEEKEIIPLAQEDLLGEQTFDIETASEIMVDEKGNPVAYFDDKGRRYDRKGNPISSVNLKDDVSNNRRHLVTLYKDANFNRRSVTISGSPTTYSLSTNLSNYNIDNQLSSFVLGPGCEIRLYKGTNQRGDSYSRSVLNSFDAHYHKSVGGGFNDEISSIRITCKSEYSQPNNLCGYVYRDSYVGGSLPIFWKADLEWQFLSDVSFNNNISSVATNMNSRCKGIMLYDKSNDHDTGAYFWVDPDADYSNLNFHGINNTVSRIVEMPEVAHDHRRLNKYKKVVAITYRYPNFRGQETYWYHDEGSEGEITFPIASLAVAPNSTFSYYDKNIYSTEAMESGYYPSLNASAVGVYGATRESSNTFCGTLFDVDLDAGTVANDNANLPIFDGLTNYSLPDGKRIVRIYDINTSLNDKGSAFSATDMNTRCKGVTLWDKGGNKAYVNKRAWYPVDGKSYPLPTGINNAVSGISTEGCTKEAVGGLPAYAYNEMVHTINRTKHYLGGGTTWRTQANSYAARWGWMLKQQRLKFALSTALTISSLVRGDYWVAGASVVAGTCYVAYGSATKALSTSEYYERKLFPLNGAWTTANKWMAGNLAFAAQHGFRFDTKADFEEADNDPVNPFVKTKPLHAFPINGGMETLWKQDPESFWSKVQEALKAISPTPEQEEYKDWYTTNSDMQNELTAYQAAYLYLNSAGDLLMSGSTTIEGYITAMGTYFSKDAANYTSDDRAIHLNITTTNIMNQVNATPTERVINLQGAVENGTLQPLLNTTNFTLNNP